MGTLITHLHLGNWRNFKNVELDLGQRAFIVGPNASGKTNLLDALRFLKEIASKGGSLQRAVDDRRGLKHLRSLHAGTKSNVHIEVRIRVGDDEDEWTYLLEIEGSASRNKPLQISREIVRHGETKILDRPIPGERQDSLLLTQTHLEQTSQNARFRALAEALASIVHVHVVPQVAKSAIRAEEFARRDAPGSDFIEHLARLPESLQKRRLKRIERQLKYAVPRFSELRVQRDDAGKPHLEAKYEHWRHKGGWQNEQDFSDGTLRLIGLFWAIDGSLSPLLLEEPELSLHADVVRQLPRLLTRSALRTGRQFIVSTHSEEMLHDRGIRPDEVIILEPTEHETLVRKASDLPALVEAAASEISLARAVRSVTRPAGIEQLSLPF